MIHTFPPLCFEHQRLKIKGETPEQIMVTTYPEYVTCPYCVYYTSHPDARELERSIASGSIHSQP